MTGPRMTDTTDRFEQFEGRQSFPDGTTFEVFHSVNPDLLPVGWYWQADPEGDIHGPFRTTKAAYLDAMEEMFL